MKERVVIDLNESEVAPKRKAFRARLKQWREKGYEVLVSYPPGRYEVSFPFEDDRWFEEVAQAAEDEEIESGWQVSWIRQVSSDEDIARAPLFYQIHTGRSPDIPCCSDDGIFNLTDFVDFTTDGACRRCGAGASQAGPVRVRVDHLNWLKGGYSRINAGANEFVLMSADLKEQLERSIGGPLPSRPLEVLPWRGMKLHREWVQLVGEPCLLPEQIEVRRMERIECRQCGAVQITGPYQYYFVAPDTVRDIKLPPITLCPFWGGELETDLDGRVRFAPDRDIWLRGDVARALAKHKIRHLDLKPIIWKSDAPKTVRMIANVDPRHL